MPPESTNNTNKLAVLSNIAYECLKKKDSQGISRDRVNSALAAAKDEFKHVGLGNLEYHSSNQDMFAVVDKSTKEVFVAYRGTTLPKIRDLGNNLAIATMERPGNWRMNTAQQFAHNVAKDYPGYSVTTTGHSLGGAIAEHVAQLNGYKCESFNAGFAATSVKQIGKAVYENVKDGLSRIAEAIIPFYKGRDNVKETQKLNDNIIAHHMEWDVISAGKHLGRRNDIKSDNPFTAHSMNNFMKRVREYDSRVGSLKGVNLSVPDLLLSEAFKGIKGIVLKGDDCYLQTRKGDMKGIGVDIGILATALLIYYDPSIKQKGLRFSLDLYDPKNPEGDYEIKHTWPDVTENRNIIGNTILGNIMFEADYLMKQMSLGVTGTQSPFIYPPHLKAKGLRPSHELSTKPAHTGSKWCRFWLEVKSLKACETSDSFLVDNVEMCVKARQMIVNSSHELEDAEIQDIDDESYKFASIFTQLYEDIAKVYPVFTDLKQVALANAIASWCWEKRIPIDLAKLKAIYSTQIISGWSNTIPTIRDTKTTVTKNGNVITMRTHTVMGGVNMSSLFDFYVNPKTGIQETRFAKTVTLVKGMTDPGISILNPLIEIVKCAACNNRVERTIFMMNDGAGKAYCIRHHPLKCGACDNLVNGEYKVIGDIPYHKTCFICCACLLPIEGAFKELACHEVHVGCEEIIRSKLAACEFKPPIKKSELHKEIDKIDALSLNEDRYGMEELKKREDQDLKRALELSLQDEKKPKPQVAKGLKFERESLEFLTQIFPQISEEDLTNVLRQVNGDLSQVIDFFNN